MSWINDAENKGKKQAHIEEENKRQQEKLAIQQKVDPEKRPIAIIQRYLAFLKDLKSDLHQNGYKLIPNNRYSYNRCPSIDQKYQYILTRIGSQESSTEVWTEAFSTSCSIYQGDSAFRGFTIFPIEAESYGDGVVVQLLPLIETSPFLIVFLNSENEVKAHLQQLKELIGQAITDHSFDQEKRNERREPKQKGGWFSKLFGNGE